MKAHASLTIPNPVLGAQVALWELAACPPLMLLVFHPVFLLALLPLLH